MWNNYLQEKRRKKNKMKTKKQPIPNWKLRERNKCLDLLGTNIKNIERFHILSYLKSLE